MEHYQDEDGDSIFVPQPIVEHEHQIQFRTDDSRKNNNNNIPHHDQSTFTTPPQSNDQSCQLESKINNNMNQSKHCNNIDNNDDDNNFDIDEYLLGATGLVPESTISQYSATTTIKSITPSNHSGYDSFQVKTQQTRYDSSQSISLKGVAMQTDDKKMPLSDECKQQRSIILSIHQTADRQSQVEQIRGFLALHKAQKNDVIAQINNTPQQDEIGLQKLHQQMRQINHEIHDLEKQLERILNK